MNFLPSKLLKSTCICSNTIRILLLSALSIASSTCTVAATIGSATPGDYEGAFSAWRTVIFIRGEIVRGDSNQLIEVLKKHKFGPYSIMLDSPGGSVAEALKLAQIVEKSALTTKVPPGRVCLSACFFVFLAGYERRATAAELMTPDLIKLEESLSEVRLPGFVGIHRPFEGTISSARNGQSNLMRAVVAYLDGQLLPRRIIDAMMTRPSNDIYWLNAIDLEDIGDHPAQIEEFLIQKCGYDRNATRKNDNARAAGDSEKSLLIEAQRLRASDCEREEYRKLHELGRTEIRKGWLPSLH